MAIQTRMPVLIIVHKLLQQRKNPRENKMDASYKIQRGIHVHLIQFFMCPEFWVHITGCLRFLLQFFCYSAPPRRRLFRNCIPDRSGYTCLASGKGDLTGKCHDPEKQQKRSPQKAVSSAENRLSGAVFSNAFRLSRVIVSDHLPPQISLAGQRLTARVPIGRAIHCVLIGQCHDAGVKTSLLCMTNSKELEK